ncbi:MAG: hypothetical protein JXA77_13260 [Bacteroidales bacterium]|nr:hypothetical protein [Bacteroidales bacterium]
MLNYILELTERILHELNGLTSRDKELICDQVNYALNHTRSHILATRKNDIDKSDMILSTIWLRTSNRIKAVKNPIVQELAKTMEEKSKYWSNTNSYDKSQFDEYNMRLSQVESTLNFLSK